MTNNTTANSTSPEKTDIEKILDFFVALYRMQIGARREAESKIATIGGGKVNPKLKTYDLQIYHADSWMSRRLTVGPIGEDSGSKSKCFIVIYDNKLVIKIPPVRVTSFEKYIENIEKERRIVQKLQPRESIVPGVSAILGKIHQFPRDSELKGEERENIYLQWLRENPEYQEYLKIDDGFAFFMDLSEYLFLGDALSLFSALGEKVEAEIIRDPSIVDDFEKFEGRYGLENAQIGMDLKSVYEEYEERVRALMIQSGASPSVLLYKIQHWFFLHLAGKQVSDEKGDLTDNFRNRLNEMISELLAKEKPVVDEYRQMIKDFLQETSFSKHKARMEGIIANILELLAWLGKKGIAMRDIKPDNLLIAGDPSRYPNFLATPDAFSIGLIDVETAVDVQPENGKMAQPLLGGTPFYATPTHMFSNKALYKVYKDLPRLLCYQDWFAIVAMIYGTIIGSYLFGQSAKKLLMITKKIQKEKDRPPETLIPEVNKIFWPHALAEFRENLSQNENQLRAIKAWMFESVQLMLIDAIKNENHVWDKHIKRLILRQVVFKNAKNREQLYQASGERMAEILGKLKQNQAVSEDDLALLQKIKSLKNKINHNQQTLQRLEQEVGTGQSVYAILEIMFYTVYNFMYKQYQIKA